MLTPTGDHVGRRFFDAMQKSNLEEAAHFLTVMVSRHLQSEVANEATLQVFLSAHLVSAFDLSGNLEVEQLGPIEDIIRSEVSQYYQETQTQPGGISLMIHRILNRISVTCGLKSAQGAGRLEEVRAYIDANYSDPNLSVTVLAEKFGFSISYLSRAFKEAAGIRPNDYIHTVRISHAQALLRDTDIPICQIAGLVGFSSSSAFIRAYRSAEAITPGSYRERARRMEGSQSPSGPG